MPTAKVLDISHHNNITDYDRLREEGIVGIIHKSTQGTNFVDSMYLMRRERALKAGLLWGAYHFATAANVEQQVDHFLKIAQPDDQTLIALDHEPNQGNQLSLMNAVRFLEVIEIRLKRKAVLYSGNLIKEQLGKRQHDYLASHRLWIAQYGPVARIPPAWDKWWLWQFSESGKLPGAHGQLDLNAYDGSDEQLRAEWANFENQTGTLGNPIDPEKTLQQALKDAGFDPGPIDGIIGKRTIRAFQRSRGLAVDGIAGPITKPLLDAALKG